MATAKTSTINRATSAAPALLERYCRGLDNWPCSWMASEKDLPPGEKLDNCFRPLLENLVHSSLSPKTIQKHVDNLWTLGGEIIRDLNENSSLRRKPEAVPLPPIGSLTPNHPQIPRTRQ